MVRGIILISLLGVIGCQSPKESVTNISRTLECAWSYEHTVCLCYGKDAYARYMTWVPDRVCKKTEADGD